MTEDLARRISIIVALVQQAPGQRLGRTAVMKLLYFLSVLRNVSLGYRFTLYSYGPFDSEVLQDLDYAQSLGALTTRVVGNAVGYGYDIQPGSEADSAQDFAPKFLRKHQNDVAWVLQHFGRFGAADLELAGTIVYVDRESSAQTIDELAQRVRDVKPHFTIPKIRERIQEFKDENLLKSIH